MGGGRGGAASRRDRRYEKCFLPGVDSHATRHARGGRAAEGRGGATAYHDARRGDARARGSRGADSAPLAIKSPARWAAGVTPAPSVHSIQAQNPADGILLWPCLKG